MWFLRGLALALCLGLSVEGLAADDLMSRAQALFKPIPMSPALTGIASAAPKVELGKMLYFDPRISASHAISCNSCHNIGLAGADAEETSIGHQWQRGGRNAPTVFNAVFNTAQFWDGRAKDLEAQAGGPMVNPIEMASPQAHVSEQLAAIPGYVDAFKAAFPGEANPVTLANAQKAIAVFEATLITPNAPFDRYLRGDASALDTQQTGGLRLFIERGCAGCHKGINIGGDMYAPFGVVENPGAELLPPNDKGRLTVTKSATDAYVFKVPTLRNIALTAPYFHTGRSWDLRQAVAVMGSSQLGTQLLPGEIEAIVAFLESLTGEQPKIVYPILPASVTTTPRPQP
ncbi:MAG: cytochrome-c peroxidase [Gammaproteobacteria bacterium]|nr:cytochrome-c peroxidase [Gammaproteobacteria bacterium]